MRRWGRILVVALLVLVGTATWALRNVDRLVNENRDWIEARLEKAVGRPVSFGQVGLSLWGGLGVRVSHVEIADDPAFSEESFLRASAVRIEVGLRAALFGRLEIREVVVEEPVLRIVRTAEGWNVDSIGSGSDDGGDAWPLPPQAPGGKVGSRASMAAVVALVSVRDGRIEWVDRTESPPLRASLYRIDAIATGAGTSGPISLEISAATTETGDRNVRVSGEVGPLSVSAERRPDAIPIDLSLQIEELVPGEPGPGLRAHASAVLRTGPPMHGTVEIDASGTLASIHFEDLSASVEVDDEAVRLRGASARVFDGTVAVDGTIGLGGPRPTFEVRPRMTALDLDELLAGRAPEAKGRMAGRLSGEMVITGAGREREEILGSLRGTGRLAVEEGVIFGVNLPDAILEGLTGVRGLTSLVSDGFRSRWSDLLTSDDTAFDELSLPIDIADRRVRTTAAVASARDYALRAEGFVDFEGRLDLDAKFVASEALSADVFGRVRELRSVADADGRLVIPTRIVGDLPDVRVVPDAAFVREVLAQGAAELGRQLLGGDGDADGSPSETGENDDRPSPLERGVEWLRGLLAR